MGVRLATDLGQSIFQTEPRQNLDRIGTKLHTGADLAECVGLLKNGESDRAGLTRPRWQAGYDLAMGRALAARARVEGYNAMLAALKRGRKFESPTSSRWVLIPDDNIQAGSSYQRLVDNARTYLERVTTEHAGTPWARIAEKELETKLGWKWTEQ